MLLIYLCEQPTIIPGGMAGFVAASTAALATDCTLR